MAEMEHRESSMPAQRADEPAPEHATQQATPAAQQPETDTPAPEMPHARQPAEPRTVERRGLAGIGWMVYAGAVMIVLGGFQAIWGFTSLFNTNYFIVASSGLAIAFNYTAWAWIHIAIAILLICTGVAILMGRPWGRYAGIVLAALAALGNFLAMAAFPVWSIVMIAVDIAVIYALAVHGRELETLQSQ
jgi:hypothetical protein